MTQKGKVRHGYHDLMRPEILRLIPTTAKRILDAGCGTGELGTAIKSRQDCHITGIEINTEAAEIASTKIDEVFFENLNRWNPEKTGRTWDCIILGDILEHLISPWTATKNLAGALSDDGVLIASIPNIAHPWIISQLQKGLFRYDQAGICDITHLRFFTKTTIFQLFYTAGLKITYCEEYPKKSNPIQYLVKAIKPKLQDPDPQVTIMTLTLNAWEYTRQFLGSVKVRTHIPHKILVIDNGSSDETVKELRANHEIFHIENTSNLGFGRGFNIGMQLVTTPYFAICNNDIVVTDGWLQRMIDHMRSGHNIAAIGPMSNYVSGPQMVLNAKYKTESELEQYAFERMKTAQPEIIYSNRIVFFCTVFDSNIIRKIGFLDEQFGIGNFEDDDYCMRIAQGKLASAIDSTVFVHHYGSKTFQTNQLDYKRIFEENQKKFLNKWKKDAIQNT